MSEKTQREWFDSIAFEKEYHTEVPLGSFCSADATTFRLWAPLAERVSLHLYRTGHEQELPQDFCMKKLEKGIWSLTLQENLDGRYYTYDVTTDGTTWTCGDPYARACGLNGERSMVIDLARTDPHGWESDRAPAYQTENIIYEVHIKDFSWAASSGVSADRRGRFSGLCESGTTLYGDGIHSTGLDYLKALGVTHIQLMPSYDYGSVDEGGAEDQFNWGYDPMNYNVPEGSYSTDPAHGEVRIRELKELIQTLHASGFRVIMDVVYNHTYRLESHLFRSAPWYYYRQNEDGSASNGSGCGNDLASERSMCARYILESVLYWTEEYHIDGFRFDLMGLLDVDLMQRIRTELDTRYGKGEKLLFGEPWAAAGTNCREGTVLADKQALMDLDGIGAFCDATRDAVKGNLWHAEQGGFVSGGEFSAEWLTCCLRGWQGEYDSFRVRKPAQTISYLSSHDDWTMWDRLVFTMDQTREFTGYQPDILRANRMGAAINFCCQGNLFLLSGEEFGRTKNGDRNSYKSPLSINRLDWERAWNNRALVEYYTGLIALRKQLPGLTDKSEQAADRWLSVTEPEKGCAQALLDNSGEDSRWETLLIYFNVTETPMSFALPDGDWQVLADGSDSFLWREERMLREEAEIAPVSVLILGK